MYLSNVVCPLKSRIQFVNLAYFSYIRLEYDYNTSHGMSKTYSSCIHLVERLLNYWLFRTPLHDGVISDASIQMRPVFLGCPCSAIPPLPVQKKFRTGVGHHYNEHSDYESPLTYRIVWPEGPRYRRYQIYVQASVLPYVRSFRPHASMTEIPQKGSYGRKLENVGSFYALLRRHCTHRIIYRVTEVEIVRLGCKWM